MPNWPTDSNFPQRPMGGSFDFSSTDTSIDDDSDTGPWRTRERYSARKRIYAFGMLLDTAQVVLLRDFFDTVSRSTPFDFPDPIALTGTVSVRFTDVPKISHKEGDLWNATVMLRGA